VLKPSPASENSTMQVRILRHECCGNAECVEAVPDVFQLDSHNKAVVLDSEAATPEVLRDAAESCPCQAIEIEDDEGNVFP